MQPAFTTLPELDGVGNDAQSSPERGHRDHVLALEAGFNLLDAAFEVSTAVIFVFVSVSVSISTLALRVRQRIQHARLLTSPRADATAPGPRVEVHLTLVGAQPLDLALDADLALERLPPEGQAGVGIRRDVGGLATRAKVGVDDEAARVELLEVDDA